MSSLSLLPLLVWASAVADDTFSSMNDRTLRARQAGEGFSFLVAGHVYGSPRTAATYPASSFQGGITAFNAMGLDFVVSLGDAYRHSDARHLDDFRTSVSDRLTVPLYNAVGNHETATTEGRRLYEKAFGKTVGRFVHGRCAFIFLDTEKDGGRLDPEQIEFLETSASWVREQVQIRDVFIFSHKLVWAVEHTDLRTVYSHTNSPKGYAAPNGFERDVFPLIATLSSDYSVYWMSGDIGCPWSLPLFHHVDSATGITYVATGIADTDRDAVIRVDVPAESGPVRMTPISLTDRPVEALEHYGLEYWENHFEPPGVVRRAVSLIRGTLRQTVFWVGVTAGIGLLAATFASRRWFT